jgi:hypothetical protein
MKLSSNNSTKYATSRKKIEASRTKEFVSPKTNYQMGILGSIKKRRVSQNPEEHSQYKESQDEALAGKLFKSDKIDLTTSKTQNKNSKTSSKVRYGKLSRNTDQNSKSKKRRKLENVRINLNQCKFEVLKRVATDKEFGL